MKNEILSNGEQYIKRKRFQRRWYRLMLAMSSVVVFAITYAMILPAITMEQTEETLIEEELVISEDNEPLVEPVEEAPVPEEAEVLMAVALSEEPAGSEEPTGSEEPLELTGTHIDKTASSLKYRLPAEQDWKDASNNSETIPGNAAFQLKIGFQNINLEDIKNHGNQMSYQLPDVFRYSTTTGDVRTLGGEKAGTLTVSEGKAVLKFDETWLSKLPANDTLNGSFLVEAEANLSKNPSGGNVAIGDLGISFAFEEDLLAKYGDIRIEKTLNLDNGKVQEESDAAGNKSEYLHYSIKVTAGKDGCPEVVIKDQFDKPYVDSYEFITPTKGTFSQDNATENSPVSAKWTIGTMAAGEIQTLTYKVKLKPEYLGIRQTDSLTNTATPYLKGTTGEHERKDKSDSTTFQPRAEGTMSKISSSYDSSEGTISYAVWIKADENNNYTLDNVIIKDSLDGSVSGGNKTEEVFLPYLQYVIDSFSLYKGGWSKINPSQMSGLAKIETDPVPEISGQHFTCNVGSLAPGEGKTLFYKVKVSKEIFTKTNEEIPILNRATFYSGEGTEDFEHYNTDTTIAKKEWTKKSVTGPTQTEETIDMGSELFTVPAGSYKYEVVVNEAADWDISQAVMQDQLTGSDRMKYVGYLRIDATKVENSETTTQTGWVNIAGDKGFTLTSTNLTNLGLPTGKCKYVLTYYAKPDLTGISSTVVTNTFKLTGTVEGWGLGENVKSETKVELEGTYHFGAEKKFWYDDYAESERSLYWILSVTGNEIPEGTSLKDVVVQSGDKIAAHVNPEVVKAFIADSSLDFSGMTIDGLSGESLTQLIENTDYQINEKDTTTLSLKLKKLIHLETDKKLYFVIKTKIQQVPSLQKGEYKTFKNEFYSKDAANDSAWVKQSEAEYHLFKGGHIFKQTAASFHGTTEELAKKETIVFDYTYDRDLRLDYTLLKKAGGGTYVAWKIVVNQASDLQGEYRIVEDIPEGLEVAYIQRYSLGRGYEGIADKPSFVRQIQIPAEHTECLQKFEDYISYYYQKGQRVFWDVNQLRSEPESPGKYQVTYLLVCKLTDPKALLEEKEIQYTNQVYLKNKEESVEYGSDIAKIELGQKTLDKSGQKGGAGASYSYTLKINPLGTDLISGSDTIRLIDEMSDLLTLKLETIQVVKTGTTETVNHEVAVEGQKLILTLPDDMPLTVTYEVSVNAAPDQVVTISNKAYWEGHSNTPDSVTENQFSYALSGTITNIDHPKITITKVDQSNANNLLSGAEFTLVEMCIETENEKQILKEKTDGVTLSGTTQVDGTLVLGAEDTKLSFDTVYRLTETKAPDGYVKDEKPYDFLIISGNTLDYNSYTNLNVKLISLTDNFQHTVYNHKGEIQVTKNFADAAGNPLTKSLNGTYTFGLFKTGSSQEGPMQTTTITFENGVAVSAESGKFTNVELNTSYAVYELDDNGKPIKGNTEGTVSGIPFVVSYDHEQIQVTADAPTATVTVTNRMNYAELPETGGYGTYGYTIGGTLLSLSAAGILCCKLKCKRSKKEEETSLS